MKRIQKIFSIYNLKIFLTADFELLAFFDSFFSFLSFFLGLESESLPDALPALRGLAPPDAPESSESVVATLESYSSATSLSSPGLKSSSVSSESPLESSPLISQ